MAAITSNNIQSYAQFPNLDQLTPAERGMFVKEHEFEAMLATMIAELTALLDTSSSNASEIQNQKNKVSEALSALTSSIESDLNAIVNTYITQLEAEKIQVEAAQERLKTKIRDVINVINVNMKNRTITYDAVMGYKLRILNEAYNQFGYTSPYQDGRSDVNNNRYTIVTKNVIALRDIDEGVGYKSIAFNLDPSITKEEIIKICSFEPIKNGTELPSFLAELIISGDLYAFKGILSSSNMNMSDTTKTGAKRTAIFDAEYFINQDLPFAIKTFYDSENNRIVLALAYDDLDNTFTSIVKFDVSINLLVGKNLHFSPNCTKLDNVSLSTYQVRVTLHGLREQSSGVTATANVVESTITHGSSYMIILEPIPDNNGYVYSLPNINIYPDNLKVIVNGKETNDFEYVYSTGVLVVPNITGPVSIDITASSKMIEQADS